jgi:hypothetical protein
MPSLVLCLRFSLEKPSTFLFEVGDLKRLFFLDRNNIIQMQL